MASSPGAATVYERADTLQYERNQAWERIKELSAQHESDAKVIAALREALSGIVEYCSGDGRPLALVAVRNTAERALAAATHVNGSR